MDDRERLSSPSAGFCTALTIGCLRARQLILQSESLTGQRPVVHPARSTEYVSFRLWSSTLMIRAYWRSPEEYEGLRSLDAPGFALQFVNRNPDFVRDQERLEQAARDNSLDQAEADAFARRWGLRFRDGDRSGGHALDCTGSAECDCTHPTSTKPRRS